MDGDVTTGEYKLKFFTDNEDVAILTQNGTILIDAADINDGFFTSGFTVFGKRLGQTFLTAEIDDVKIKSGVTKRTNDESQRKVLTTDFRVVVLRRRGKQDAAYRYGIIALTCVMYLAFGCKLDLKIIWKILRRPISHVIGILSQFIIMPLLSFGIGQLMGVFGMEDSLAFGLLAMGCSPGGGASNVWVNLVNGDLDLSVTMTTISTVISLGFMPMWIYALGRFYIDVTEVMIPYTNIAISLLYIIIPAAIGLIIRQILPKVGAAISRCVRYVSLLFLVWAFPFGMYVNWYMYIIMGDQPLVIVSAILLPLFGYTCGALLALLSGRKRKVVVTIAIETGVQNASIPIILLMGNFLQPIGDLAAVMPVATSLFYLFPILIAALVLYLYDKYYSPDNLDNDLVKEPEGETYDLTSLEKPEKVPPSQDTDTEKSDYEKSPEEKVKVDQVNGVTPAINVAFADEVE